MEIRFLDLEDKELVKQWDEFCFYDSGAWFWHTTDWMKYTLAYRLDRNPVNHSFMIIEGDQVIGIVPLIVEENMNSMAAPIVREFSYGAGPVPMPIFSKYISSTSTIYAFSMARTTMQALAIDNDVVGGEFQYSVLCDYTPPAIFTEEQGYALVSGHTQLLTLDRPFPALLRQMRKGHISDVKRGMEMFNLWGCDSTTYGRGPLEQYRELHARANGRVCRSPATFEMQYDWMQNGNGLLFAAIKGGVPCGFVYLFLYKNKAYFGSACNDPNYKHLPIGHALQGAAIQRLALHGYKQYELGAQYGPATLVTAKAHNIAHFKHGFGGVTVPVKQWRKGYNELQDKEETAALRYTDLFSCTTD